MSDYFFDLKFEEQKAIINIAASKFGLPDYIIEKDLWLCWLLEQLCSLPQKMAFKGGTSLSKVFGLIDRFSEDVDITIDYRNFIEELNFVQISRSQIKRVSESLKMQLKILAEKTILPHLKKKTISTFPNKSIEITLSKNGEKLRYYYPTLLEKNPGYLRDHVLIEFGVRNSTEPCEKHMISPFLAEVTDRSITLPTPFINTLSPLRTFWEKATLIHVECHRKRLIQSPERLSRHWYDLFLLSNSWVLKKALLHREILKDVIQHKKAFFNASYANYDNFLNGNIRLIPDKAEKNNLETDYKKMIEAGMFPSEPPEFTNMVDSLHQLEVRLNNNT